MQKNTFEPFTASNEKSPIARIICKDSELI